jgi:hypothetical protein
MQLQARYDKIVAAADAAALGATPTTTPLRVVKMARGSSSSELAPNGAADAFADRDGL